MSANHKEEPCCCEKNEDVYLDNARREHHDPTGSQLTSPLSISNPGREQQDFVDQLTPVASCSNDTNLRRRSPLLPVMLNGKAPYNDQQENQKPSMGTTPKMPKNSVSKKLKNIRTTFSPSKVNILSLKSMLQHENNSEQHHRKKQRQTKQSYQEEERADEGKWVGTVPARCSYQTAPYIAPTSLHEICYDATCGNELEETKRIFQTDEEYIFAASVADAKGQLPLHILARNKALSDVIAKKPSCLTDHNVNEKHQSTAKTKSKKLSTVIDFVVSFLMPANPSAITHLDNRGCIPFQRALEQWIDDIHQNKYQMELQRTMQKNYEYENSMGQRALQNVVTNSLSRSKAAVISAGKFLTSNNNSFRSASNSSNTEKNESNQTDRSSLDLYTSNSTETFSSTFDEEENTFEDEPVTDHGKKKCSSKSGKVGDLMCNGKKNSTNETRYRCFPSDVQLTAHVEFSLVLLSAILDRIDEGREKECKNASLDNLSPSPTKQIVKNKSILWGRAAEGELKKAGTDNLDQRSNEEDFNDQKTDMVSTVVEQIASIPNLIKTLLLIDDDTDRERIFSYSIVQRVMLNKNTIKKWLTSMLLSQNKMVLRRAIDYFQFISTLDEEIRLKCCRGDVIAEDAKVLRKNRDELQDAMICLEGLIPSMLALDEKMIEEAATTSIISRVLDKMISSPFALSVVFFDGLFLALLVVSFRASANGFVNSQSPQTIIKWVYVTNTNIFYFIIRELGKAISLSTITRRTFWLKHFWSFWNIVDIMSIIMALSSVIALRVNLSSDNSSFDEDNRHIRGCFAITTGLLWLKVLGLLKSINMQLATFVLAIVQITRDILWFLSILLVAVISFAQMFYTLMVPDYCATNEKSEDTLHCSQGEYYLKVYSILLGDFGEFEREDFSTVFSVLLFVFFSFMVVIVLLNVLIAIISDSYEKCLVRSKSLFGRARVMLLAELVSFQNLLRRNPGKADQVERKSFSLLRWRYKWTHETQVFFYLSATVVILWICGETAGYLSGEFHGNIKFSITSIFVNVALLLIVMTVLSKGAAGITDLPEPAKLGLFDAGMSNCCSKYITNFVQRTMMKLLGMTEENSFVNRDLEEWQGRVLYLQREMARVTEESTAQVKADVKSLELEMKASDSHLKSEIKKLEMRVTESEEAIRAEIKASEKRIEKMVNESAEYIANIIREATLK